MVNKAVVGVIGVILIGTLGVGALVGLQGGGAPADDSTNGNGNGGGPQGTATSPTATPNGTAGNGTAATASPAQYEMSLSRSQFTEAELERNISQEINAWRAEHGLESVQTGSSTTTTKLRRMAREHSRAMADLGEVTHRYENNTTRSRYESSGLFYTCQFKPPGQSYTAQPGAPDVQQFEWLARTPTPHTFSQESGIMFHQNESTVAKRIVAEWRTDDSVQYGLLSPNYGKAGIGVEITRDGTVYATVELCGN